MSNGTIDTFKVDMCDGEVLINQGTIDTDVHVFNASTTWNNVAIDFNAIELEVTDTFLAQILTW